MELNGGVGGEGYCGEGGCTRIVKRRDKETGWFAKKEVNCEEYGKVIST